MPSRRLIPAKQVKERFNHSEMTLWRRVHHPDPGNPFPKPIYEGRRRYWIETDLVAYEDRLMTAGGANATAQK